MTRVALAITLLLFAVIAPDVAAACSVCYGGAEESRKALHYTTVLLSMLPVGMIVTLGWWVWRAARAAEAPPEGTE
jgi:hypothetical protein